MKKFLNYILSKQEIKRGDGTIYLNRWTLFRTSTEGLFSKIGFGDYRIYLHKFTESDHTKCLHDHPNKLTSFIFINGYEEEFYNRETKETEKAKYNAPCLRTFPASHAHRVTLLNNRPCWSIVLMRPKCKQWGFYTTHGQSGKLPKRKWVKWDEYEDKYGGSGGCE